MKEKIDCFQNKHNVSKWEYSGINSMSIFVNDNENNVPSILGWMGFYDIIKYSADDSHQNYLLFYFWYF